MENNTLQPPPAVPPPKPQMNKWLRLGRKILIGALITWCVNFFLLRTGWDNWEKFSKKADSFGGTMMDAAIRLSPLNLYKSITTTEHTYAPDPSSPWYLPRSVETGKVGFGDKLKRWFGYYWYNTEGKPFWFGRLLMLIAVIYGVGMAREKYDAERDKSAAGIAFPFNVVIQFFIFLLGLGFAALILYLILKLLLAIVGGLVVIFSTLAAGGGIIKIILDEVKNEAADTGKKTIAATVLPFLFKTKTK